MTDAPLDAERPASRFPVEVEGFAGSLEELVQRAQRGDVDLAALPVGAITRDYRARVTESGADPRDLADFVSLAARLLSLKARRLLPEGPIEAGIEPPGGDGPIDDPGARLAEYRLFRAAAEALLAEAAEEGMRSFLGLVSAEVAPTERLSIPPERLAAAFRRVLERLPEIEELTVDTVTYSVEEKAAELGELLRSRGRVGFDEIFETVRSRLEAVACFLALLELVRGGRAAVDQEGPFAAITVTAVGLAR